MTKVFLLKYLLCISFFVCNWHAYANSHSFVFQKAKEIISLYEKEVDINTKRENLDKIDLDLVSLREIIQREMKEGRKEASIDLFLFVIGVVKDELHLLQSLLFASQESGLSSDLKNLISLSSARKLAYATKENRIAFKTRVSINNNFTNKGCQLYINGHPFSKFEFVSPAGIPFYTAIYCANSTFSMKRIQPEATQKHIQVSFTEFKNIIDNQKEPSTFGVPNPNSKQDQGIVVKNTSYSSDNSEKNLNVVSSSMQVVDENYGFSVWSGIGYLRGLGLFQKSRLSNLEFDNKAFIYSTSYLKYSSFVFSLDFSPVNFYDEYKILYYPQNGNPYTRYMAEDTHGILSKGGVGVDYAIFSTSEQLQWRADFLFNVIYLQNHVRSEHNFSYGVSSSLGPVWKFQSGLNCEIRPHVLITVGAINDLYVGVVSRIGFEF